jgi:uncharacterized membrane protein (UPF0127 family)
VPVASGFFARLRGLAFQRREAVRGLYIPRCDSIHTFGMRFELDVVFFDAAGRPISVRRSVPPCRILREPGAASVLEVPSRGRSTKPGGL